MRQMSAVVVLLVVIAAPAAAQIPSRPTDPPLVTAINESWYQLREPVQFAGELYYPAGATVFFNGNTMVRTGHYNGIPLYADTTVEPFSLLLVPISRGLMQPYERPRRGGDNGAPLTEIVGTTGIAATPRREDPIPILSMRRPDNNDGVWILFGDEKWVSGGTAIPLVAADFVRVGEYAGFPVFARRELTQEVIYLPTRAGLIAPYRLKN